MHSKLAVLLLPALAAAYPQSGSAPSADQITIADTSYSGNGCPQGSVSTSTSPDKTVSPTHQFNSSDVPKLYMHKPYYIYLPRRYTAFKVRPDAHASNRSSLTASINSRRTPDRVLSQPTAARTASST
jgi:hypothetical protein